MTGTRGGTDTEEKKRSHETTTDISMFHVTKGAREGKKRHRHQQFDMAPAVVPNQRYTVWSQRLQFSARNSNTPSTTTTTATTPCTSDNGFLQLPSKSLVITRRANSHAHEQSKFFFRDIPAGHTSGSAHSTHPGYTSALQVHRLMRSSGGNKCRILPLARDVSYRCFKHRLKSPW